MEPRLSSIKEMMKRIGGGRLNMCIFLHWAELMVGG